MQAIMILRSVDNEPRLKTLLVDDNVLARLTRIRGNLFKDDPRLTVVKDLPTPEPKISPEMQARAEASWAAHCMERQATPAQPQPERPKTPEETWRYSPALRAEFGGNLASYLAYCKAAEDGRCKVYGKA